MFFKNLKVYRLKDWRLSANELNDSLSKLQYTEGSATTFENSGWAPPCESPSLDLVNAVGQQYLLSLRMDRKLLPSSVINKFAKAKASEIEQQQGYKPGRKQMKEIKEQVTDELLPKAFTVSSDVRVWIDTANNWLVIDSPSSTKCDQVIEILAKTIEPFPVIPLYTELSPAAAMTQWLVEDEAPVSFTIDQETELRSSSESKATIKYVRQSIKPDEAERHVVDGKQVSRLALTWNDRVSFVLTDGLDIKRVTPLDVLKDQSSQVHAEDAAEAFDGEFALMAGELGLMLENLVGALGGERIQD